MAKTLVLYYSAYGHIERMAHAVAEGVRSVAGSEVTIKRVVELVPEETARQAGMKVDHKTPIASVDERRRLAGRRERLEQTKAPSLRAA